MSSEQKLVDPDPDESQSINDDDNESDVSSSSIIEKEYSQENKEEGSDSEYTEISDQDENEEDFQLIEGDTAEVKLIDLNSAEFLESEEFLAYHSETEMPFSSFQTLNISASAIAPVPPSPSSKKAQGPKKQIFRRLGPIYNDEEIKEVGNVTDLVLSEQEHILTRIDYPGYCKDYNQVIRTLGGLDKLTAAFNGELKKRLELKFRPWDMYSKPAYGDREETCGILIKVRRKKAKEPTKGSDARKLITPDKLTEEDASKILEDEREMFNQTRFSSRETIATKYKKKKGQPKGRGGRRYFIKPSINEQKKSNIQIEVLGITTSYFSFNGLCDFQYLPSKFSNGEVVSIEKEIFPIFGDPDKGQPFIADLNESPDNNYFDPQFIIPNVMARFDRPHKNPVALFEEPVHSTGPEANVVKSTREKRVTFAHMYSFLTSPKDPNCEKPIPTEPMEQAIGDVTKKFLLGTPIENMKQVFEKQPIWSKLALEVETKRPQSEIRFLLPCVAYFALNGPWRSLWIRLGYDPRKSPTAFAFQLLDYRVPQQYKSATMKVHSENSQFSTTSDTLNINTFSFISGSIPPKTQMFYQLCNVHITEIEQVRASVYHKIRHDPRLLPYSPRFGFLSEALLDFCRYSISRHIEVELLNSGKIRTTTFPVLNLNSDGTVPKAALKSAISGSKEKKKRIRLRKQVTAQTPSKERPSTSKAAMASFTRTRPVRKRKVKIEHFNFPEDDEEDDHDPEYIEQEQEPDQEGIDFDDPVVSELLG